ncbi:MAG: MarR family transcriptional regulator [Sedimenticola sp.]
MEIHDKVLISLRQIIRAIDLHSKKLERESGSTGPQLLVMQSISRIDLVTAGQIANEVNLSQATVTTILDRLEKRAYVTRERSHEDKRKVMINLTEAGELMLKQAPALLQESFIDNFGGLKEWEQNLILSSLQRVAVMMQAGNLDAAPLLDSSDEQVVKNI